MKTAVQDLKEHLYKYRKDNPTLVKYAVDEIIKHINSTSLPLEKQQIEAAYDAGSKCGYISGSNAALRLNKTIQTTAVQDANQYYSETFKTETDGESKTT